MRRTYSLLFVFAALHSCAAFYLPGVAPKQYKKNDSLALKVVKLTSRKAPMVPYEHYHLPFCEPETVKADTENLGEILSGDVIETSPYELRMKEDVRCKVLCVRKYTREQLKLFDKMVRDEYRVHWVLDNLPAVTKYIAQPREFETPDESGYVSHYEPGFALGFTKHDAIQTQQAQELNEKDNNAYLNNHVVITVFYHGEQQYEGWRIVGFEVDTVSANHKDRNNLELCKTMILPSPQSLNPTGDRTQIIWTYDVIFKESPIKWASRWDAYLKMTDSQVHWFSIINSCMILLFLTGMVAMIIIRALHKDFIRYNRIAEELDDPEDNETGWKLVHGDVFRPPPHGELFSVLVGTGFQVFAMTVITMIFAVLGFLSPANRGGLMTALLLLFVFMGVLAGYFSTRTFKMFNLDNWRRNTLMTALLFPGINFSVFFVLNLFIWAQGSSGAVPFGTMFALLVLWFGISVPLVYFGAYWGYRKPQVQPVTPINMIPRQIPEQQWYMQPPFSVLVGGVLPFGAVFIEIFFIMSSIWLDRFYYMFTFLFIVLIILIITCAEITIVMCYFQLCAEDYSWWWRSYLTSGSSAVYLFLYSILYFFTKLNIVSIVSSILFFGYMFLISLAFFVLTGTIGFAATFLFTRKIYGSIKID